MLTRHRTILFFTCFFLLLFPLGCPHQVETIPKVELHRTSILRLTLQNDTSSHIKIIPAKDEQGGPHIDLMPGSRTDLTFQLVKIADLEATDYSWMRPVAGSETNLVITNNPVRYIDLEGEDGLIRIRNNQDRLWKFLLDVESCLENTNVIEEIVITGPPEAGIPIDLCE
jgi:hypothetical protein